MSQRALVLAVVDYLREKLSLDDSGCGDMDDGQPPPWCGDRYIAVWEGAWTNSNVEALDERYGVYVTVTMRLSGIPFDRASRELTTARNGLTALCEQIRALLHIDPNSYEVVGKANAYINAAAGHEVNGFVEPLTFLDGGRRETKGGDWLNANSKERRACYVRTMTFGGARRVQRIEDQT